MLSVINTHPAQRPVTSFLGGAFLLCALIGLSASVWAADPAISSLKALTCSVSSSEAKEVMAGGRIESPSTAEKQVSDCALLTQGPLAPTASWYTSASNAGSGFLGYEFLHNINGTITGIRWWGINAEYISFLGEYMPCDRDLDSFTITFYENVGGAPGTTINWFTGFPTKTYAGSMYGLFPLYEYTASLNPTLTVDSAWVSIEGAYFGDCRFLWMQSNQGDMSALQWQQTAYVPLAVDLSLCVSGTPTAEGEGSAEGSFDGEGQSNSPVHITQQILGDGYTPGGYVDIRVTIEYEDTVPLIALGLSQSLPAGWTLDNVIGGEFPGYQSFSGEESPWEFFWYNVPSFPVSMTYRVNVPAAASGTYSLNGIAMYFLVTDSLDHWSDPVETTFGQAGARPANDNFANPTSLGSATTLQVQGRNVGATKEAGEPNHAGMNGGASVWWTWTAPAWVTADHKLTMSTKGTTFDTGLAVYQGSAVNNLSTVAANDDAFSDYTSQVIFSPTAGGVYAIAVDGYRNAQGPITLSLSLGTGTQEGEGSGEGAVDGEGQAADPCPGSLLPDPGFEDGTGGYWLEYNTSGYAVITYDESRQRTYEGDWFAWLGGVRGQTDVSGVEHVVTIPSAAGASLKFFLSIPARSENGVDVMRVYMDDDLLLSVWESDATYYRRYAQVNLDVTAYADGAEHVIRMESNTTGMPSHTSFFVDNVCVTIASTAQNLTLQLTSSGPGTVYYDPAQAQYAVGDWVLLFPVADSGAEFVQWQGGGGWISRDEQYPEYYWLLMTQNQQINGLFQTSAAEGEGQSGDSDIFGVVRIAGSNSPLSGVQVQLNDNGTGAALDSATTDDNGRYVVTTPNPAAALKVTFTKQGYTQRLITDLHAPSEINVSLQPQTLAAPAGLTAFAGLNQITLKWDAYTLDNLAGFNVYRAIGEGTFAKINAALAKTPAYTDADIESRARYRYKVTAVDAAQNESPASAEVEVNADTLVMWLPQVSGPAGSVIRVPLNVSNASGINPNGIDIVFLYPAELLGAFPAGEAPENGDPVKVEQTVLTQDLSPLINASTPGRVVITATGKSANLAGEGHLFDVLIPIKAGAALDTCKNIEYSHAKFYNDTVPPQRLPVTYAPKNAFLCINSECKLGDVNGDNEIDSGDVLLSLQLAVKLLESNTCQKWAGDLNGDRNSDSADAVLIQRLAAELPLNPPMDKDGASRTLAHLLQGQKQDITVSLDNVTCSQGGTINVPVNISNAPGLGGADLTIAYSADSSKLTLQSVAAGSLTSGFSFDENIGDGFVRIAMSKIFSKTDADEDPYAKANGTLAVLTFHVAPSAAAGAQFAIKLSETQLRGEFGDNFDWYKEVTLSDGKITVSGGNTFALTTAVEGQGSIVRNPQATSYAAGTIVTLQANAASGWEFDHWTGALSGSQNPTTIAMNANQSVTAVFVESGTTQYTLTIQVEGNGTTNPAPGAAAYDAGTAVQVTATAADNWRFVRWEGAVSSEQNIVTMTMNADQTITAVFEEEKQNAFLGCQGGAGGQYSGAGDLAVVGLLITGLLLRRKLRIS